MRGGSGSARWHTFAMRKRKHIAIKGDSIIKRQKNIDHLDPRPMPNVCHLLDPPLFSLQTTFNGTFVTLFSGGCPRRGGIGFACMPPSTFLSVGVAFRKRGGGGWGGCHRGWGAGGGYGERDAKSE
jgi:hypothetical protein